ncbi:MAG TPA: stage II sporulation protein M [Euzebyales bacterium]|nr:stage II sporulation protein M [Euzebyales bacterium]
MDIDGFISANSGDWRRLDELLASVNGRRRLPAAQVDELVRLYERVSTHLSIARTRFDDHALNVALTRRVGRARALIYGSRTGTWRDLTRFFTDEFPGAVWESRWAILVSLLLFMVPAVAVAAWLANSPEALDVAAPPALREAYVEEDFEAYYSSQPAAQFASFVTVNNIRVSILAFAGGVLACVPTILVMALNGANGGVAAGMFAAAGQMPRVWGLVLPHGLLELTAVFIAGGSGLRLGWALIDPGDRPRKDALAEEGRRAVAIVVGLILAFVGAGLVEGFVTGSRLPTWARVGIGIAVETAFLGYLLLRGPVAVRRARVPAGPAAPSQVHNRPAALVSR